MAIRLARSRTGKIALGLGLTAVTLLLAIMLTGGGHGWNTPLLVSIPLWVLYPLTFYAAGQDVPQARPILWILAIIALATDALLIFGTVSETSYVVQAMRVNGAAGFLIAGAWCVPWIIWQVVIVRSLLDRRAADADV